MNRSDWLTDELIEAAFERRAGRAAPGDLRETILTLSAASSQRSRWRLQLRSTLTTSGLRPGLLKGVAVATVIGVIAVGAAVLVTRPNQRAVGGPSPAPDSTSSPSTPASPSAGPRGAVVSPRAPAWTATAVVGTLYLGVVITALGYAVWNWCLERVGAARVAAFVNVQPLAGALLGVWWLHEPLTPFLVGGGLLIVAGLHLTVKPGRTE